MRHSITHIRQSDQATKFKWLVGLSTTAAIIIIAVWVLYMRSFIFTGSSPDTSEDVRIGFWPVFKNGLTITQASIVRSFDSTLSNMPSFGRRETTISNPK